VVATTVSRTLPVPHMTYTVPAYELLRPREILLGLAVAPVLGIASAFYVRVLGRVEVQLDRLPRWSQEFLPPLGMLATGLLSLRWPQVPGNGFDTVNAMLLGEVPLRLLLALPFVKLAATALCAGSGVPGGLFTPSLFYGAALGGALGSLADHLWPGFVPPGALALIGMAGVLAGTTHAVVSSVLILFEMTADYGVILPLMLCAAIAAVVSKGIERESLYTAPLRRRGVALPELPRPAWMRSRQAAPLVSPVAERVAPTTPFPVLVQKLLALPPGHDLYVTTDEGTLIGVIRLDALKGNIPDQADLGMIVAADVMDRTVMPITTGMTLADVVHRFRENDLERFPVVDRASRLVGAVSIRDVLAEGRF